MSDENTVGGVSVDVTANLGTYKADMAGAKATAADLDSAFSKLSETSQRTVKALVDAGASAKTAAAAFGGSAEGLQKLAAFTELTTKATVDKTAATVKDTAATTAQNVAHINSRVAYESLVAVHEVLQGRFNRLAGTSIILGQALLGNAKSAELLKAAISPVGAAIAGVTAIAIAGAVSLAQYEKQQRDLLVSSVGLGAASGISSGQASQLSGQGLLSLKASVNDNLKATESYTAAGVRNASTLRELTSVTQDYAVLTGEKAKDATKELAKAMEDPVKGAAELNAKLSILDGTQLRQIRTLTELGDKAEAQAILTDALKQRTEEANAAGVNQDNLFHKIAVGASDAATGIGKLIDAELKWGSVAVRTVAGNPGALPQQLQADKDRIAAEAKLQRDAQDRALSAAGEAAVSATPDAKAQDERDVLGGRVGALKQAILADTELRGAHSDAVDRDRKALAQYNRALDSYDALATRAAKAGLSPEAEKTVELYTLEGKALNAKTDAQKKAIAEQKEALALTGKVMSQADANALISAAGDRVKAKKDTFATKDDTLAAQTRGELALAEAYGVSDAAAMKAAATTKALVDEAGHHRTALQAEKIAQDELNLSAAKAASESAKKAADLRAETEALTKADEAVAAGTLTRKQADQVMKEELALRPLEAALANSSGAAKATLSAVLKELTKDQKAYNDAVAHGLAVDTKDRDKDELEILKLRQSLVNAPKAQQDVAVARLSRQQALGDQAAATPAGAASIQSAGDVAGAKVNLEALEQYRQMTLQVQAETVALEKQGATLGMTLEAADKYNIEQKLLLETTKAFGAVTDEQRAQIDKLADGYAQAAEQARNLAHQQKGAADAAKTVTDSVEGGIEAVIFDGQKASDAMRNIAKSLGKDALKATLSGEGPLASFFGTDQSKTVGGPNGGVLSQLFGAAFGQGKAGGAKPAGTVNDPLYTASALASGAPGTPGNPLTVTTATNAQTGDLGSLVKGVNGGKSGSLDGLTKALPGVASAKPDGSANNPFFVIAAGGDMSGGMMSGGASGGSAGGTMGIGGMLANFFGGAFHLGHQMFDKGVGGIEGLLGVHSPLAMSSVPNGLMGPLSGGMGGGMGEDAGGALSSMAGLFHTGTSYVGTPHRQVPVSPQLFIGAPRLHSGLAPDEFPAILQQGERVTAKDGRARGGGRSVVINVTANDAASFGRSRRQIERAMDRRAGQRG